MDIGTVNINGEKFIVMGSKYQQLPGRIEGQISIGNNQHGHKPDLVSVEAIKNDNESLENLTVGIIIYKSSEVDDKAKKCGIEFPSEKNKDKWVGHLYMDKFRETTRIGLFYGNPFSEDKNTKKEYEAFKNKMLTTDFFGPDAKKRANFVAALEEGIKTILGYEQIKKLQTGPSKFIGNDRSELGRGQ